MDDDGTSAVNIRINSVSGAHSRPDGLGMADNASRKAVLHAVMQALAVHLPL